MEERCGATRMIDVAAYLVLGLLALVVSVVEFYYVRAARNIIRDLKDSEKKSRLETTEELQDLYKDLAKLMLGVR